MRKTRKMKKKRNKFASASFWIPVTTYASCGICDMFIL